MKRAWVAIAAALMVCSAQAQDSFDTGPGNLLAVLRESSGINQDRETLQPYGTLRAQLPDGSEVELETSWFRYVGDMHIRLVFDSAAHLQSASPEDLDRLQLEPEQALQLAVANMRRTYGEPTVRPWRGGLMQVLGRADDLNSSYFLDRTFWQSLEARHAKGLVVAVPQRGGLLYAPADDDEAVAALRFSVAALYASANRSRVSSALYLFREGRWSVFQSPMAR
ncbi:hypothetical protein EZ313_18915 [Ramlibacter henchirensis]|uniref:DUF1444 family protein n=1 Tax=Ramlibacter henchirensis TaxID=204072 RepID=A0A4Z0BP50_9BURK|nr:hypothetical protein [Ramlibacter henchirensis]TFZ00532.1 hypothetical protein EZ313_18915 [Ramlibacter henchirensis]